MNELKILKESPCKFRGEQVHLPIALDNVRDWYRCGLGYGPNGIVTTCKTCSKYHKCNSKCVGYIADMDEAEEEAFAGRPDIIA